MLTKKQLQSKGFEFTEVGNVIVCRLLNPSNIDETLFIKRAKTMQTLRLVASLYCMQNNMLTPMPV